MIRVESVVQGVTVDLTRERGERVCECAVEHPSLGRIGADFLETWSQRGDELAHHHRRMDALTSREARDHLELRQRPRDRLARGVDHRQSAARAKRRVALAVNSDGKNHDCGERENGSRDRALGSFSGRLQDDRAHRTSRCDQRGDQNPEHGGVEIDEPEKEIRRVGHLKSRQNRDGRSPIVCRRDTPGRVSRRSQSRSREMRRCRSGPWWRGFQGIGYGCDRRRRSRSRRSENQSARPRRDCGSPIRSREADDP